MSSLVREAREVDWENVMCPRIQDGNVFYCKSRTFLCVMVPEATLLCLGSICELPIML